MKAIARKTARLSLLMLALGGCSADTAGAQDGWLQAPDVGFIALGFARVATGELDDRLAANGYPTFGTRAVAPSLGAYWDLPGGLMLGGEWHGIVLGEEDHERGETGLGGGSGTVGIGYAVDLSPRVRLYPRLGVGGGGLGLWIEMEDEPDTRPTVGFDEALDDPFRAPRREAVLSRTHWVVDVGGGAEVILGGGRGAILGLRFGYRAAPSPTIWELELDEWDATGGPDATIAGPYFQVLLGGGRRR